MLLIAEIILTITAWRKGWRGWALLPMAVVLGLAFVIGLAVGAAGGSDQDVVGPCLILEVLGIVALIIMAARAPKTNRQVSRTHLPKEVVTVKG